MLITKLKFGVENSPSISIENAFDVEFCDSTTERHKEPSFTETDTSLWPRVAAAFFTLLRVSESRLN
jgi:hypothetical protein